MSSNITGRGITIDRCQPYSTVVKLSETVEQPGRSDLHRCNNVLDHIDHTLLSSSLSSSLFREDILYALPICFHLPSRDLKLHPFQALSVRIKSETTSYWISLSLIVVVEWYLASNSRTGQGKSMGDTPLLAVIAAGIRLGAGRDGF